MWCNYYKCWCADVEDILDEDEIECTLDCSDCVHSSDE